MAKTTTIKVRATPGMTSLLRQRSTTGSRLARWSLKMLIGQAGVTAALLYCGLRLTLYTMERRSAAREGRRYLAISVIYFFLIRKI